MVNEQLLNKDFLDISPGLSGAKALFEGWGAYVGAVAWYDPSNTGATPIVTGTLFESAVPLYRESYSHF